MKILSLILALCLSMPIFADDNFGKSIPLLSAAITTTTGTGVRIAKSVRSYLCYGTTSAGSGSATIKIEVSNDNSKWAEMASIALTLGTTYVADGFAGNVGWLYQRGRVSAISGTNASVTCSMGY